MLDCVHYDKDFTILYLYSFTQIKQNYNLFHRLPDPMGSISFDMNFNSYFVIFDKTFCRIHQFLQENDNNLSLVHTCTYNSNSMCIQISLWCFKKNKKSCEQDLQKIENLKLTYQPFEVSMIILEESTPNEELSTNMQNNAVCPSNKWFI